MMRQKGISVGNAHYHLSFIFISYLYRRTGVYVNSMQYFAMVRFQTQNLFLCECIPIVFGGCSCRQIDWNAFGVQIIHKFITVVYLFTAHSLFRFILWPILMWWNSTKRCGDKISKHWIKIRWKIQISKMNIC